MTRQSTFKRKVRARMRKTGESYTAARRRLIGEGERPAEPPSTFTPPMSDEKVRERTGLTWAEWFEVLDGWEAAKRPHREIATWLREQREVEGWWAQSITVAYEQARGLRAPGQRPDGWEISASKTVAVPVERLYAAVADDAERDRWLPGAELSLRTATEPRSARYDWEDGSTRLVMQFESKGESKSTLSLAHQKLPDAEAAEEMKAYWRERVGALKELLES